MFVPRPGCGPLDDGLELLRHRSGGLGRIALLTGIPLSLVLNFWLVWQFEQVIGADDLPDISQSVVALCWFLGGTLVQALFIQPILCGAVILFAAAERTSREITVWGAIAQSSRRLPGMAVAGLLIWISLLVGSMPGLFLLSIFALGSADLVATQTIWEVARLPLAVLAEPFFLLVLPIIILEKKGPFVALVRGASLASMKYPQGLMLCGPLWVLNIVLAMLAGIGFQPYVCAILLAVTISVARVLTTVTAVGWYFTMRAEFEFLDIELLLKQSVQEQETAANPQESWLGANSE